MGLENIIDSMNFFFFFCKSKGQFGDTIIFKIITISFTVEIINSEKN